MKLFFSGIGGSGVSALAGFASEKGHTVFGSDRLFDREPGHPVCSRLKAHGISIVQQNGEIIDSSFDQIIFSTAVEKDNPDFKKAEAVGCTIKTRPEYLAGIVLQFRTVAVAGTSGKSTVSGMLAFLMDRLGLDPNFIGGGRVKQFITDHSTGNYRSGKSDILVIEACESDGTIIDYTPRHSLFLNLDLDHHSIDETAHMFTTLAAHTTDMKIINADDKHLTACGITTAGRFSLERDSEYHAHDVRLTGLTSAFSVRGIPFLVSLPGRHNIYNALACIAFLSEYGIPLKDIAAVIHEFTGIQRRFDIHLNNGKHLVVDDYAHNPHKIASLMQTMKDVSSSVCYIFQPHGFGPTRLMKDGYIRTFGENLRAKDHLVLLPIYYAGGTSVQDISSADLADGIKRYGKYVEAVRDRQSILDGPLPWSSYVVFGARDDSLSVLAEEIARRVQQIAC